ncbi:uncharacterized protein K444DRAFT_663288 [Hyaloscypha bicolor E]|uniref:Uncharacterized protein n=1 Tax=Hyaloscypha bicolor E TaxID=1095630 RepID=A0A2J6TC39_9HELO|nr:uncharacterized protein K444DRAFT_663288 [Hyaloscypha bicolor E]PMD60528.1 hypothetical protein K444DRAFT_663288 [Hyaloscypha bicolor E]
MDDEDGIRNVQEANAGLPSKPNGIETPKRRAMIAGQRLPPSTASTQPPPLEEVRAQNCTNTAPVRRDESLSTHNSMLPVCKGLLFPRKQVATAFRAYRLLWVYKMGCQQLLGLLGNKEKGSAQRLDRKRGSQLMLGGLAVP